MPRPIVPNLADVAELSELDTLRRSLSAYAADQLAVGGDTGVAEASWASGAALEVEADMDRRNAETQFAAGIMTQVGETIDAKLDPIKTMLESLTGKNDGALSENETAAEEKAEGAEGEKAEGGETEASDAGAAGTEGGEAAGEAGAGEGAEGGSELSEPTPAELAANDGGADKIPAQAKKAGLLPTGRLVVSQNLPGYDRGRVLDNFDEVADVLHLTARELGNGQSHGSLTIELDQSKMDHLAKNDDDAYKLLRYADPGFIAEQPEIMASGGWGAHSEVRYDLFGIEDVDGILELPTIGVDRGGLKWPVSPSIADALPSTNTGIWLWTEANDITAAANDNPDSGSDNLYKPHYKIPIPTMAEKRLDLHGVILDNGNLVARAWPEAVRRFIALTMAANTHTINSRRLTALAAAGTAVDLTTPLAGVSIESALIGAWALKGATYRRKYAMADNAVLECVIPSWVPRAIALALPRRQFDEDRSFVAAKLTALAMAQDIRLHFVQDWEMISATATAFPSTFHMMVWAPGTFVIGQGPTIDLGVVRDSALNNTNDYTAVWTEQALSLMEIGHESLTINMPGVYTGVSKIAA